jgi:hypothetical protein
MVRKFSDELNKHFVDRCKEFNMIPNVQYDRIIDDEDLQLNNNAEELLIAPNEFLEDLLIPKYGKNLMT